MIQIVQILSLRHCTQVESLRFPEAELIRLRGSMNGGL